MFSRKSIQFMLVLLLLVAGCASPTPIKDRTVPNSIDDISTVIPTLTPIPIETPTSKNEAQVKISGCPPLYQTLGSKPNVPPQSIKGVTVELVCAYADEANIFIGYTITGWDSHTDGSMDLGFGKNNSSVSLKSKDVYNFQDGGFIRVLLMESGVMSGTFAHPLGENDINTGAPANAHLEFDISINEAKASFRPHGVPGDKLPPASVPVDLPEIGTFHFEFTTHVFKSKKVTDINQSVTVNDVTITLKTFVLNRSQIDALLCFDMPSAQDWHLSSKIKPGNHDEIDGFESSKLLMGDYGNTTKPPSVDDPVRCSGINFIGQYDEGPTTVRITIPKLTTGLGTIPERIPEDLVKKANERLADKGIAFEVVAAGNGNNFNILKRPDGMPDVELYPLIWDAFSDWYEGPWVFTVEIKP